MENNQEIDIESSYVYIDWNVVKYIKNPRADKLTLDIEFGEIIRKISKQKYRLPFSLAHIQDRINRYKPEYESEVQKDLEFLEDITDGWVIGWSDELSRIVLSKASPVSLFKLETSKQTDQREKNALKQMLNDFFSSPEPYKNLRDSVRKFVENNVDENNVVNKMDYNYLIEHMMPILDLLHVSDVNKLKAEWKNAVTQWSKMNSKEPLPIGLLLSNGYMLLDFHPLFREDITKKNNLDNILRDENHTFWGMDAKYFVSEDKDTLKKIRFLYDVFQIKTKVRSMSEFVSVFS